MEVQSAVRLVKNLVYKPGWVFEASDHTNRFEGTILVKITYPARASERNEAPEYAREIRTYATFPVIVASCDDVAVYAKIVRELTEIEVHEIREFLRVQPTMWAPFHPHRLDGMARWAERQNDPQCQLTAAIERDLKFGVA